MRAYHTAAHLPFLVETGVNYLRPRPGELSDGAYIAGVAGRADCGILLDLHNLLTNERNGRQPVSEVLDELPLERVLEVHVAGGFEAGGYYLDAHVGAPDEELLALTASVIPRLPNLRAVMYEAVPESLAALGAAGVREILVALHRLLDGARRAKGQDRQPRPRQPRPRQPRPRQPTPRRQRPGAGPGGAGLAASAAWERALAAYTSRASDDRPADDPGIGLLRQLADAARRGGLALACPDQLGRSSPSSASRRPSGWWTAICATAGRCGGRRTREPSSSPGWPRRSPRCSPRRPRRRKTRLVLVFGRDGHDVGLGELVHPRPAEFAADAAGVDPPNGARSSTAVALWLLKKVTPVRSCPAMVMACSVSAAEPPRR